MQTNILNPSAAHTLNPDFGYNESLPSMISSWQARSGRTYARQMLARGRIFDLVWNTRLLADKVALQQWHQQYEQGFFTLADWEAVRQYSGRFAGPPQFSPAGYNQWNIKAQFIEIPGLAMNLYPTGWGTDSIFLGPKDDFAGVLLKLTGTWTFNASGTAFFKSGIGGYFSTTTNDTAEWQYFGYGFRLWAPKEAVDGIVEISLDGSVLTTVDLYAAGGANSAVVYTNANVNLGMHRVKLRVTGTKNAGSSNFTCYADSLEVMR